MIKIKNANKTFQKDKPSEFQALKNVDLTIENGELVAIIGKSGAGKTTLLHIIACIDDFDEGAEYFIDEIDISTLNDKSKAEIRNKEIGIVFQDFALIQDFTVFENVEVPLILSKHNKRNRKNKVREALKSVNLENYINKDITNLSGGEKQRIAIARAIVNNPNIILADEPTGSLDTKTGTDIFNLLKGFSDKGKTVVIITHDRDIANKCDRIIEIADGKIIS